MRFLVPYGFKQEVRNWILAYHSSGKRSNWFPHYHMSDGSKALMANIELEDALAFALAFEHEKMDKE
jgi:hypothetical protein